EGDKDAVIGRIAISGYPTRRAVLAFDNWDDQFLRGAWISRAFQNQQLPGDEMRSNRFQRRCNVTQVGLPMLIQGRRDANHYCVGLRDAGEVRCRREASSAGELNLCLRDPVDVGLALHQSPYFLLINIEPAHREAFLRKQKSQRKANIAEA